MRSSIITLFALLFTHLVSAQDCLPTEITLSSYMNDGGPAWYAWDIMTDDNQMLAAGIAQFTPDLPNYPASACLLPGCYTLNAVAMTMIQPGSTFASFDPTGGYWSDYEVTYDGMSMQMTFCIVENQPCEIAVAELESESCAHLSLVATTPNSGAVVYWSVNGGDYTIGSVFDWEAPEQGTYEVCAAFETPDCPEGVFWCETFVFTPECFENDCPYDFIITQEDCYAVFYLSGAAEGEVTYYVNGSAVNSGEMLYTHLFTENGNYSICAVYEGICDQTEFCQNIEVAGCNEPDPCSIDFEVLPMVNCGGYVIFPVNYPVGADVFIEVDGVLVGQGVNDVLFMPSGTGQYEVCVYYESVECKQTVQQCELIQMIDCADDCGMTLTSEQVNCGEFNFNVDVPSGWQNVSWTINGEAYGGLVWEQNIQFLEEGTYEICATYENAQCGFHQECTTVVVENCIEGCTEFTLMLFSSVGQNGPAYVIYAISDSNEVVAASGATVFDEGTLMQTLDFCLPAGCYTILVFAPDGGLNASFDWLFQGASNQLSYELVDSSDSTLIFEACLEPTLVWNEEFNCSIDVDFSINENGAYVFEATSPEGASVYWLVNGEEAGEGDSFVLTTQLTGAFEVCAYYFDNFCPNGAIYCSTVLIPDVEIDQCTEVTIEIANNSGFPDEILVNALLESLELELGFDVTLYELSFAAGIGFCLPDGCYDFTLGWEEFALINLFLTVSIDGNVELEESIDVIDETVTIELAINTDCTTGIAESNPTPELVVFPHPADQAVNIRHNFNGAVNVIVFDLNGRMVASMDQMLGTTIQLPTAHLSPGMYVLQITDGKYVKQAKMQIQR